MRLAAPLLLLSSLCFAANPSGIPNFHQVSDRIYRGAQPANPRAFSELAKLGIKTVIDLREPSERSVSEKKLVEDAGMHYVAIPMAAFGAPADSLVAKVLALFEDAATGPVFVHCRRGSDRTGTVIAVYRMVHDHWENAKALAEAKAFGMSWTERAMQAYIAHFHGIELAAPGSAVAAQNQ
jgi:tyrosine-protein phosphatase SIW14